MSDSPAHVAKLDQSRPSRVPKTGGRLMGIPIPPRMTREQIHAAERFSLLVFGAPLFDREPSHNGRHGYGCEFCLPLLAERDAEAERVNGIRQPWELAA